MWPFLVYAYQISKNPKLLAEQFDVSKDLKNFHEEFGFLGNLACANKSSKNLLVVNLSDGVFEAKMEGVLAKALEVHSGCEPVILTNSTCYTAVRYFKVFGFKHFIFWDEFIERVKSSQDTSLWAKSSFDRLLNYQFRGVFVGRHMLSSIIRTLRHGSLDFNDPLVQKLLKQYFQKAEKTVFAAEQLIDKIKPDTVLFLEKGYSPYGEIFDVAINQNLNVVHWGHSHKRDSIVFKRYNRTNRHFPNFSLSPGNWAFVRKKMLWNSQKEAGFMNEIKEAYEKGSWFNRKFLLAGKKIKSPDEVRAQLGLDKNKKTAIIFSHVLWDATFFYGENIFKDYEDWLIETVKAAQANSRVNWIVKIHPDYIWKMKQLGPNAKPKDLLVLKAKIGELGNHIKMMEPDTDISTYSLFPVTDYCLTVRGTIGVEMACFGVPVLTAGTGRYSGMGFTIDSKNREEYLDNMRRIEEIPRMSAEQTTLARKHAFALFKLRPFRFTSFEMTQMSLERLGHLLDHNLTIDVKSSNQFTQARDLKQFSDWTLNFRSEEDFLNKSIE